MSELLLPEKTMTWAPLPYTFPINSTQTNFERSPDSWGRCNGFPAVMAANYNNPGVESLFQFDETGIWQRPLINTVGRWYGPSIINDWSVFCPVTYQAKGVLWSTYHLYFNYFGVPSPSLPDGVCIDSTRFDGSLNPVCFPQGSFSCATTDGGVFIGTNGNKLREQHVLNSAAGCPAVNNYGASLISAYSDGSQNSPLTPRNLSTSQGSGLGFTPIERMPDIEPAINWANGLNPTACDLGLNLVAVLTGPSSYSGNPTLLRVYRYTFKPKYPSNGLCDGQLYIQYDLIYEKNLMDLMPKPRPTYFSAGGLISPAPGVVSVSVQQGPGSTNARKFFFFKFPGPIIQPVNGQLGLAPSTGWLLFLTKSGRILFISATGPAANTACFGYSVDALNLNYSITSPSKNTMIQVNKQNTLEIVNINRSF